MPTLDATRLKPLIEAAEAARRNAYAPYSHFLVGAALLGASGRYYVGCNVENASYPVGCCAERNAIGHAVVSGERHFDAVVVVTDTSRPTPPCGMCRQALSEFGDMLVVLASPTGEVARYQLFDLLPEHFGPDFLKGA
ncbi:MAG: cytidine deaminase [Myxococcales bacterium]|nr:cytidine deaminase [Myxococcales bacterium]